MAKYQVKFEIYEGNPGELRTDGTRPDFAQEGICAWMYGDFKVGQKFHYPEDLGQMCPWLVGTLNCVALLLLSGGTLGWKYSDTPYEKVIDPDGVTTEFIRCPDPTRSGVVIKVTRTAV